MLVCLDVAELELDEMIKLSDISLPEGVSIPALAQGEEADRPVVTIQVIKEVVIEEPEEEEGLEAAAEGEAPAEAPSEEPAGDEPESD